MPSITILRESKIERTPRVMQMEGIFDVPPSQRSAEQWTVNLDLPAEWNVGLIVGPSGSGKTTVARELFGPQMVTGWDWPVNKSILDGFPQEMSIKEVIELLSSVGFSSPPSWVRPFGVLSNGEQFRVNLARTLAEMPELAVVDEFTSVVDRTVAQIGSAAVQKTVRRRKQKFIAVSCHYDIIDWLEPDWVYQPHTGEYYAGRYLHQRPRIELEVKRVHSSAWQLFRKHHYLDTKLNDAAVCFVAFWKGVPVAFTAILHFPHAKRKNTKREHRTVCLPDYQGVGIGNAMSDYIGAMCKGLGYSWISQTSHPAMMRARAASRNWRMISKPNRSTQTMGTAFTRPEKSKKTKGIATRLRATFEYIGPALPRAEAERVWNGN
jgi:ABC-type lipoprotein export system ATPase subunit